MSTCKEEVYYIFGTSQEDLNFCLETEFSYALLFPSTYVFSALDGTKSKLCEKPILSLNSISSDFPFFFIFSFPIITNSFNHSKNTMHVAKNYT